jgi:uncharacterized membrane protein
VAIGACDAPERAPLALDQASPSRVGAELAYTAVDISGPAHDLMRAFAINRRGDVLGIAFDTISQYYAIQLRNGTRVAVPSVPPECYLNMSTLTNTLWTAGVRTCDGHPVAFRWRVGSTPVPQRGVITPPHSDLFAMNEDGVLVGQRTRGGICCTAYRAAPGKPTIDLFGRAPGEHTSANAVNRVGVAVGHSIGASGAGAMRWDAKGTPRFLGQLGWWTTAMSINDRGEVAGLWISTLGEFRVFHWSEATGLRDLGQPKGESTYTYAINNHGEIVGHTPSGRAWVKTVDGPFVMLPDLPGSTLGSSATAINDCGQIVGSSNLRAVMWTDGRVCR